MDRNEAKQELKQQEPHFLQVAKRKVNGVVSYVCPSCGNGSGVTGDGLALDVSSRAQGKHWHCFKCGLHEDVIGLWKKHTGHTDDQEVFKELYDYYGVAVDEQRGNNEKNLKSYMEYFSQCASRAQETDYFCKRGLSEKTIKFYRLGYDSTFSTGFKTWCAAIIPVTPNSYIARNTNPNAEAKDRYRKTGASNIYLVKALQTSRQPVFVVEGELDALSIIEVGGQAIALGSTANYKKLVTHLEHNKPTQPLILALDNDEAGRSATKTLAQELERLEIPYIVAVELYGEHKDANEALVEAPKAFCNAVTMATNNARHIDEQLKERERLEYVKDCNANYALTAFCEDIKNLDKYKFIPTGFKKLDDVLGGGLYAGLYIVGAISSLGKTTLVMQIADQIAQGGTDVLIFSLEMAKSELMAKSISRLTLLDVRSTDGEINHAKSARGIMTGSRYAKYCADEIELIDRSINRYSQYAEHIYIYEAVKPIGAVQVRQYVEKHVELTGNVPVVIIDYVQILKPFNDKFTDKQNVDVSISELKRVSRDFDIPVVGISSFNRANYNAAVSMESFKESGAVEYSSDVLIGLQLNGAGQKDFDVNAGKQRNPRNIEMVILKNRNGATGGKLYYYYYPIFNYFEETLPFYDYDRTGRSEETLIKAKGRKKQTEQNLRYIPLPNGNFKKIIVSNVETEVMPF